MASKRFKDNATLRSTLQTQLKKPSGEQRQRYCEACQQRMFMCFNVKCFDYNLYYEAYSSGVENIESSTFKIAFKKCFNIGVFYVAFCMENMDVFTFEPVTSFGAENMVNFTSKWAIWFPVLLLPRCLHGQQEVQGQRRPEVCPADTA